jgi:fatty acid desaturase
MDYTQRAQTERLDLGDARSTRMLRARSNRGPLIYTLLALPILGVLLYATIAGIDEWWQALVLGVIVMTTIGLMIAVSPNRRG